MNIVDLSVGDHLYALDPVTGLVKRKPVTAVQQNSFDDALVDLQTRRADFRVAPDHRIPFRTKSIPYVRCERAETLGTRSYYKFISDWRRPRGERLETVDITDFVSEYEACATCDVHGHTFRAALPEGCDPIRHNSHTGYKFDAATFKRYQSAIETAADEVTIHAGPNHHRRPYRFDGDDFIRFLGWYITEGSVYWPSSSDTAQVRFAQENDSLRQSIASLLDRMRLHGHSNDQRFGFGSRVFGRLLKRLCGSGSRTKRLPELVWNLPHDQQRLLLEVLLRGDGNDRRTYYTSSDRLAGDVIRLCLELGVIPRYTIRDGIWQLYIRKGNDGFHSARHVTQVEGNERLYRLTVEDYSVIMAGRHGKFQWIGVSGVA